MPAGRIVPPEHLHATLAFLGARPVGDVAAIVRELAAAAADSEARSPARTRGTARRAGVGMIVFDDVGGAGAALASQLGAGLERARRLSARTAALAAARHRHPLPGAAPARPAAAGARRGRCRPSGPLLFDVAARRGALRRTRIGGPRRSVDSGSRRRTRNGSGTDRAPVRQGRRHEDERPGPGRDRRHLHGLALARRRSRRRRSAAWPHRRGVRSRVVGQDDARLPRDRRGSTPRRHLRLHRCRARHGSGVREAHRREHRRAARLAARHGRAGARDLRAARALRARSTSSRSTPSQR